MATTPVRIKELGAADVRNVIRGCLNAGAVDAEGLADFLASVDWSAAEASDPTVRELLGRLEAWATEYAEGDLDLKTYERLLREASASPVR
jgi:hypothetical protein